MNLVRIYSQFIWIFITMAAIVSIWSNHKTPTLIMKSYTPAFIDPDRVCPDPTCTRYCQVQLKGYIETNHGFYIKINDKIHTSPEPTGLFLLTMQPGSVCNVKDVRLVTSRTSMTLTKYFGSLPLGAVVFGVTGGGVPDFVTSAIGNMKTSLSITLPNNLTHDNVLFFRAMKGHDSYAKYSVRTSDIENLWNTSLLLTSPMKINLTDVQLEEVEKEHRDVLNGQGWTPKCEPRWRLAIIIPFRDREQHLYIFLHNFLQLLKKQNIAFHVFILQQAKPELFNRAALMNVGYLEAQKIGHFDCFAFHDVDHIPEDACNLYSCSQRPRHLSVAKDVDKYKLVYHTMFGGASLLSHEHIQKINGFPNTFFGWGGEDDNIFSRLYHNAGYTITRYPTYVARYTTIPHNHEHHSNPVAGRGFVESQNNANLFMRYDGLNNVNYSVVSLIHRQLFTEMTVRLPGPVNAEEEEEYYQRKTREFAAARKRDLAKNVIGPYN